jgi:ABC-2 type transport system ATP-binding protein
MSQAVAASMPSRAEPAIRVEALTFAYESREVLKGISFEVAAGEIFGVLGPNGGGKTTLFRVLSTLVPQQGGRVSLFGREIGADRNRIRHRLGVVFQNPSVDGKLTVRENIRHHGLLYGLRGSALRAEVDAAMQRLGVADRADDLVETLSGGLRRRVELAKGLLTKPQVLILDEPSTGLDPGARNDLWKHLRAMQAKENTTIVLTTHLMDEAEQCDRIAILDEGRIVAEGTPDVLRRRIGGDVITIRTQDPESLAVKIARRFGDQPALFNGALRLERPDGHVFLRQLVEAFPDEVVGVSLSRPTLEDVFIHETGHRFWGDE